jgi:DNA-binding MarR family transcriptional regulator
VEPPGKHQASSAACFDSPEQEVCLNWWRTCDRLRALEDELFGRSELTPRQYNVLRLLRAEYPGTLPTLAQDHRQISRAPDITRMLDKLKLRGLVERYRPRDNRQRVRVGITESGLALFARSSGHCATAWGWRPRASSLLRTSRGP